MSRAKSWLVWVLVAWIWLALVALPNPLPKPVGIGDFRGYWSVSYLLGHGENFSDPLQVMRVERSQTGWTEDWALVAWNPPWLFVMLLPYTRVPFDQAVWWWMLTNILLVSVSAGVLWWLNALRAATRQQVWIAWLVAFGYSITLVTLVAGQVNTLVLAGLAAFLFFASRQHWGLAGASLVLTTVKPQLIYLTLPLVLLDLFYKRRWTALVGFAATLTGLVTVVFLLRPTFLGEYLSLLGTGKLLAWENPTLGSFLDFTFGWGWARLMGVLLLPLAVIAQWRNGRTWDTRRLIDVTLLLSVITAPFAWSYDFVVLLVPLLRIIGWMSKFRRIENIALAFVLIGADALSYYERVQTPSEVYFFWVPLVICGIYVYCLWRAGRVVSVGKPP